MSKTTSSPRPISRSPGSACGRAPLGPAATIAGNEGSPPSSRIRASAARATSRSRAAGEAALQRPAPDLVGQLRGLGDRRQLLVVLDPPQPLDPAAGGDQLDPLGEFLLQFLQQADRHLVVLEADPALEPLGDPLQPVAAERHRLPALDLGGGALGVAEVGEEEADAGPADAGAVGAGEAGQVADVGQVGDQHPVELALGQQRLEAVAAAAHQAPAPSSRASSSSASR